MGPAEVAYVFPLIPYHECIGLTEALQTRAYPYRLHYQLHSSWCHDNTGVFVLYIV